MMRRVRAIVVIYLVVIVLEELKFRQCDDSCQGLPVTAVELLDVVVVFRHVGGGRRPIR